MAREAPLTLSVLLSPQRGGVPPWPMSVLPGQRRAGGFVLGGSGSGTGQGSAWTELAGQISKSGVCKSSISCLKAPGVTFFS